MADGNSKIAQPNGPKNEARLLAGLSDTTRRRGDDR